MNSFTKNNKTGNYDVIGLASDLHEGATVPVSKRDGTTTQVTLGRVSKAFTAKFGDNRGKQCVIASVASSARSRPTASRYANTSGTVRCRHCGKRTPEGDDWCMVCGSANYE